MMKTDTTCNFCWGSGWETQFVTPCRECRGTGKVAPVERGAGYDYPVIIQGPKPITHANATEEAHGESDETLNFQSYLNLIGAHPHNAIAKTIWDTLELHNYQITRKQP